MVYISSLLAINKQSFIRIMKKKNLQKLYFILPFLIKSDYDYSFNSIIIINNFLIFLKLFDRAL